MSTADPARRARRRRSAGYTYIEVMLSLGLVLLLAFVVERTLTRTHETERLLDALRRVTERGQRVSFEITQAVKSSRKLFQDDAVGRDYLSHLDLARLPPSADARLPRIDEVNDLGPDDTGDPRTGNVLLFVQEGDPVACVSDPATGAVRYIDAYRFVCIYPAGTSETVVLADAPALDLVIWQSTPFPSRTQVAAIEDDAERQQVVRELTGRHGFDFAWDATSPVDAAFFAMDVLGTIVDTPSPDPLILEDPLWSGRGRLVYAKVQLSRTDPSSYHRRAVFSADDPATWSPDGFEVKIAGASGSRKVWIHVVVSCPGATGDAAVHPNTVIASTRDL